MSNKQYVTAHLKRAELQALEELSLLTGRRKHDIVNDAVKLYLKPYVEDRAKAFKTLESKYTAKGKANTLN